MPNTKSAQKRLRQNDAHRARNRAARTAVRSQIRKVRESVAAGNIEQAEAIFKEAAKQMDSAGARRLIHENTVARTKSRLQKLIKNAKTAGTTGA